MQIDSADWKTIEYSIRGISDEGKEYNENYDGKPEGNTYPVLVNGKELARSLCLAVGASRYCSRPEALRIKPDRDSNSFR